MKRPFDRIAPDTRFTFPRIHPRVQTISPEALRHEMDRRPRKDSKSMAIARYRGELTLPGSRHPKELFTAGMEHSFADRTKLDDTEQLLAWCVDNEYLLNVTHIVDSLQLRHLCFEGRTGFLAKIWSNCESLQHLHLRNLDLGESCSHADLEWVASERLTTLNFHGDVSGSDFSRSVFAESLRHTRVLEYLFVHHHPAPFIDWATENEIPLPIWVTSSLNINPKEKLAELQELFAKSELLKKITLHHCGRMTLRLLPDFCKQAGKKSPISLVIHGEEKFGTTKVFQSLKDILAHDVLVELTLCGSAFENGTRDYDEHQLVEAIDNAKRLRTVDFPWVRGPARVRIENLLDRRKQPQSRFSTLLRSKLAMQGFARSTGLSPQIADQLSRALGDDFDVRNLACVSHATNDSSMELRSTALRQQLAPAFAALSRACAPGMLPNANLIRTIGETTDFVRNTISRYERSDSAHSHMRSTVRQMVPIADLWKRIKLLPRGSSRAKSYLRFLSTLADHCNSSIPDVEALPADVQDVYLCKYDLDSISNLLEHKPQIRSLAASLSRGGSPAAFSSALGKANKLEFLWIEYGEHHDLIRIVGTACSNSLKSLSLIAADKAALPPSTSDWTALMTRLCNLQSIDVPIRPQIHWNRTDAIAFYTSLFGLRSLRTLTLRGAGNDLAHVVNLLVKHGDTRSLCTLDLVCTDGNTKNMMSALGDFLPTAPVLNALHVISPPPTRIHRKLYQ